MFDYAVMLATDWKVAVTGLALSGGYVAYRKLNKPPPRKPKSYDDGFAKRQDDFLRRINLHVGGKPWSLD